MPRALFLISLFSVFAVALPGRAQLAPAHLEPAKPRTPILIELFTSEGCSSCPAADANLIQLVREQPLPGIELIGLEEHVDYWNNLGWADPFSAPIFTQRQQSYAEVLPRSGVYTPQAVIAGRSDAVGSDREAILKAARDAAASMKGRAKIEIVHGDAKQIELRAEATGLQNQNAELWIALVEDGLTSEVPRGENAGRTLPHAGVVRALVKVAEVKNAGAQNASAKDSGAKSGDLAGGATIPIDARWNGKHLRPVAFAQDPSTRQILAAASL